MGHSKYGTECNDAQITTKTGVSHAYKRGRRSVSYAGVRDIAYQQRGYEATVRANERAELTNQQQLAELDTRLGVDQGAARERARLRHLISEAEAVKNRAPNKEAKPDEAPAADKPKFKKGKKQGSGS
jgi:hypothetical protein